MGSHFGMHLVCLVSALAIIQGIHGIEYSVYTYPNGVGVERFRSEIGSVFAKSIMEKATKFVWEQVLEQSSPNERKDVRKIGLLIDLSTTSGGDSSFSRDTEHDYTIYISGSFIKDCREGELKRKITRLICVEIASILQWATSGDKKTMIRIAYFTILKANCEPKTPVRDGYGKKWDESVEITARFFVYCNDRKSGFVAFLNRKMQEGSFNEIYFQEFFQESLDNLWKDYKNKYSAKE